MKESTTFIGVLVWTIEMILISTAEKKDFLQNRVKSFAQGHAMELGFLSVLPAPAALCFKSPEARKLAVYES